MQRSPGKPRLATRVGCSARATIDQPVASGLPAWWCLRGKEAMANTWSSTLPIALGVARGAIAILLCRGLGVTLWHAAPD
jgi:hypothetical protein